MPRRRVAAEAAAWDAVAARTERRRRPAAWAGLMAAIRRCTSTLEGTLLRGGAFAAFEEVRSSSLQIAVLPAPGALWNKMPPRVRDSVI